MSHLFQLGAGAPEVIPFGPPPEAPDPNAAPFRPFTLDEVARITGCFTSSLEAWLETILGLKLGDDKVTQGLDWMQTFAVFAGTAYLNAGAGNDRAARVVRLTSGLTEQGMLGLFKAGRTFPTVSRDVPLMLIERPKGKIGRDLNLKELYRQFRERVKALYPDKPVYTTR